MRFLRQLAALVLAFAPLAVAQQPAAPPAPGKKGERKITPAEAKKLFEDVDEILQFVSRDTGLPIKRPVKRKLTSRAELRRYIEQRDRDDEQKKRLQRTSIVLKKLGLIPREFDLDKFLGDLLEEQVTGYYDLKTKTVYLLDWIEPEAQKPVLAHELTHALQDQSFDLEKSMRKALSREDEQDKLLKQRGELAVEIDEPTTGQQAVVEGQAMVVRIDYMLAPTGRTLADSPLIAQMLKARAQQVGGDDYPQLAQAPLYLRDALMFPYTYGLDFELDMLKRGGRELAFAGVLDRSPRNTREVMDPAAYATNDKLEPLRLPDMLGILGDTYEPYDVGNVGQFDGYSLMKQFAGEKTADRLAPHWRGGAYYAAARRTGKAGNTDCAAKPADPKALEAHRVSCLAMLTETRWETPEAATQWAQRYASLLLVKYKFAQSLTEEKERTPSKEAEDKVPARCFTCADGERWMTDEGLVVIQQQGNTVLTLETFDDATTPRMQKAATALLSPQSTAHSPQ